MSGTTRFIALFLCAAVTTIAGLALAEKSFRPIRSDGFGYHIYLPAAVIDRDLSFKRVHDHPEVGNPLGIFPIQKEHARLNKYPIGTSILQLPFFLAADAVTVLFKFERTGHSLPYQIANAVSGVFYACAGIAFMLATLLRLFPRGPAFFAVAACTFATPVYSYATFDGSFSHIYSFALVAALVWLVLKYQKRPGLALAAGTGAVMGLIVAVRVPNAVLGLIPAAVFLATWLNGQRDARGIAADGAAGVVSALVALAPLLLYWKFATGHWIVYSYGGETFYWDRPEITNFLFSVRKGLFFWSPVLVFSVLGFFLLDRTLRVFAMASAAALALLVYVCASWEQWWFGGSYGSRPFVDFMPILAVPMAACFTLIASRVSMVAVKVIAVVAISINALLMQAYWTGAIPFDEATLDDIAALPEAYTRWLRRPPSSVTAAQTRLSERSLERTGRRVVARVAIRNDGLQPIARWSAHPTKLSWRFVSDPTVNRGQNFDTRRLISETVTPSSQIENSLVAELPRTPGRYWLQVSLVAENRLWFHDHGMQILTFKAPLDVPAPQ